MKANSYPVSASADRKRVVLRFDDGDTKVIPIRKHAYPVREDIEPQFNRPRMTDYTLEV